jgi:PAS domain S-box-containing protein
MGNSHSSKAGRRETNFFQKASHTVSCFLDTLRNAGRCLRGGPGPEQSRAGEHILRHLASLLDSVTAGIISLDGEGTIRVFNAVTEKLFSLPRSKVIGKPLAEIGRLMPPEAHTFRTLLDRLSDAVWAAGAAVDLEYDLVEKNGSRRVISYSVYPLGRIPWSVGNGVVIKLEDVTRKKEMEDQISDARKKLLAVFDGITDGIQVVDGDFRITAVNKSMKLLLGREIKPGARCYEGCMPDGRKCAVCPAEETFKTGQPASITKKLLRQQTDRPEDRERYVEISAFPLLDRGNRVIQIVEYIKDVTEKVRLAERLEESRRLAELGEMAARVAHEVRNPLNAITGAAHFLSSEYKSDDTLQKFTSLIKRQATRLNQVASDLLYMSKPMRTGFSSVNANAILDQSMDSLCEQLHDQNIKLISDLAPDLPLIQADELQLDQVFQNVLRNAVEAMPGGGTLRLSTLKPSAGDRIEIRIEDTGHGIAEIDRDRIFQSFFTTKTKGTGLGLTIVQRVLKNHNGHILIEQPETGGTRVVLLIPVSQQEQGRESFVPGTAAYPKDQAVSKG